MTENNKTASKLDKSEILADINTRDQGENTGVLSGLDTVKPSRQYNVHNLTMYGKDKPVLSHEEAKRNGSKGGQKSGEVRRARRTMRENLLDLLAQEIAPEKLAEMGADIDSMGGDYTLQNAVLASMVREAINGSERATALIRDTIGEQPTIRQEITETITGDDISMINNLKKSLIG